MPAYISLIKFTDEGLRNVKDAVKRTSAGRQALEEVGGRVIGFWWALGGQYDLIAIVEAPDAETLMRIGLGTAMSGNMRGETLLQIFSEEQMERIVQGLPEVLSRPLYEAS